MASRSGSSVDWRTSPDIAVNEAIATAMDQTDPSDSINAMLACIGRSMRADRAYIFELVEGQALSNTFEWCAPGVTPEIDKLGSVPVSVCERVWMPRFEAGEAVSITDLDAYEKEDPEVAAILRPQGIVSLLAIPLFYEGSFVGLIGIDNPAQGVADGMATFLQTLASFTVALLRHRNNVRRLADLSSRDRVSGAYNTLYLLGQIEQARSGAEQPPVTGGPDFGQLGDLGALTVIYLNIVQFKEFNGAFGMEEGNRCLHDIASALADVFGDSCVSRYSADHFIVFYGKGDVAQKVDEAHERVLGLRQGFKLWLEAGICAPDKSSSLSAAVDLAKVACDQIVKDGQHHVCWYDGKIEEELERKKYLQDHIEEAIEKGWVHLVYQPVIRTLTGRLAGAEALARWSDPTYGEVSPGTFVPALEEKHLSWRLLAFVVDQACSDLAKRYHAHEPVVPVSINVSRTDFESCKPFDVICEAVERHGIPSSLLCVEITESVAMGDPEGIESVVERFRAAGFEVWMDDFGSAYSSLNTLKDFSFGKLKLDMLFMHNFNQRSKDIISSIVDMAKKLGVHTLAEGVETAEQVEFLLDAGCEEIQGFYFSKPLPLDELVAFARKARCETHEQRDLYNAVGLVRPSASEASGYIFWKDDKIGLLYANRWLREDLARDGFSDSAALDALLNAPGGRFAKLYRLVVKRAQASGESESYPFSINKRRYQLTLKVVAENGAGCVMLVWVRDLTAPAPLVEVDADGSDIADDPTSVLDYADGVEEPKTIAVNAGVPIEEVGDKALSLPSEGVQSISMTIQHSTADSLETLSALTSIFIALITVDFTTWKLQPIVIAKVTEGYLGGDDLDYRTTLPAFLEKSVDDAYRDALYDFIDPATVVDRLTRYGTISIDYMSENLGWCRLFLIPFANDEDGQVTKALFAVRDVNAEKIEERRLSYGMNHDPLTKAFNRNGLRMVIDMVRGGSGPMGFTMLDVDDFKRFNDTLGHKEGDELLVRLTRLMIEGFGATDYIARIGGDEFVVLSTNYSHDDDGAAIQERIARINEDLAESYRHEEGDAARGKAGVSLSAGIILSKGGYRDDFYELADKLLYEQKAAGKGGSLVRVIE